MEASLHWTNLQFTVALMISSKEIFTGKYFTYYSKSISA